MKVAPLYRAALADVASDDTLMVRSHCILVEDGDELLSFEVPPECWHAADAARTLTPFH